MHTMIALCVVSSASSVQISDKFEALPGASVTAWERLVMSRVLFQTAKHTAACGLYRKAVAQYLVTLRIRRMYQDSDPTNGLECDIDELVAESTHALSVLVSLEPSLEKIIEENTIAS